MCLCFQWLNWRGGGTIVIPRCQTWSFSLYSSGSPSCIGPIFHCCAPSPLPSWMSSVLYRAWSLGATANSTMFTSFLKGDSSLGSQNRAGLRGELERQTHPFDFPAFLSDVLHPVKRELLGWSHCSWLIWSPLFQGPSLTSTVMISCSQDYSD